MVNFFSKGHERSIRAKKNIAQSILWKSINVGSSILIVPLVLDYLDQTRYGIWLTLASIVLWFNFFDVGLGHGLRNKLAEALANKKYQLAKKYISTTYAIVFIISVCLFLAFLFTNTFLNWSELLNTSEVSHEELNIVAIVVFGFFTLRLTFNLINKILLANQRPALKEAGEAIGHILNLLIIFVLLNTADDSLLYLSISYSGAPIVILVFFSFYLFLGPFKEIAPGFRYIDLKLSKDLLNLGGKFFVIQISAVILYASDNMIITQLFTPADVTPYQIAHRYFGVMMMGFSMIVTPFWSAITEAYVKGEMKWIKNSISKLIKIWVLILIGLTIMLIISDFVYNLWVGNRVYIPFVLSAAWAIFIGMQTLNMVFVQFINGTGKVKLQMVVAVIGALLNIPLSIFIAKQLNFGVVGVIAATIIEQLLVFFIIYVQYHKIINGRLDGIWGK